MKEIIASLLDSALNQLIEEGRLPKETTLDIMVERTRDPVHGDFASNIAMTLAKFARCAPRQLAEEIINQLPAHDAITKVEIAGPGFLNFFVNQGAQLEILKTVLTKKAQFGQSDLGQGQKVLLEYVSANPTGPLHVGHGRGAAFGASLANILKAAGFEVHQEYYVNDAGRQMNILAASVWLRYLSLFTELPTFPDNGYQGDYVVEIANALKAEFGDAFVHDPQDVYADVSPDASAGGDKERHIDDLISQAKVLLGDEGFKKVHHFGLAAMVEDIKSDVGEFGVFYEQWFSESLLKDSGAIESAIAALKEDGFTYEQEGALWFRSSHFGDEKDRVLIKANGDLTYFASDVAYHFDKYQRGFDKVIDIWGADHHGYVPRIKSCIEALGKPSNRFVVLLVQFVNLFRGTERLAMSTRSGSFVTLRTLREEVGNDAARFFYVLRKSEQHLDFDLELAKSKSNENPVYYIQYAHARIASVIRKSESESVAFDMAAGLQALEQLTKPQELEVAKMLAQYPEKVTAAAENYEPHIIAHYLKDLASVFHSYYNAERVLEDDIALRQARLLLSVAVQQVIANGLGLLGVSAPDVM